MKPWLNEWWRAETCGTSEPDDGRTMRYCDDCGALLPRNSVEDDVRRAKAGYEHDERQLPPPCPRCEHDQHANECRVRVKVNPEWWSRTVPCPCEVRAG